MDPKQTPQGTLSQINNPLVQGTPQPLESGSPSPQPSGTDAAQQPGVGGGLGTLANPGGAPFGASLGDMDRTGALARFRSSMLLSPHVTKIGDAITKTISENPQAAAQPGGVMRAVVAGGLQALAGVGAGLGDAAAVGTVPAGGGALTGIARTMGAHNQRVQQQTENDEKKRVDDANIAHMQVMTAHEQQSMRIAGNDAKKEQYKFDQAISSDLDGVNAPVMAQGMNDEQLHEWYKNLSPEKRANAIPVVDHFDKEKDPQGQDFLRPVYKVYDKGADVPLSDASAKLINQWAPQQQDLAKGQMMSAGQYVSILGQAKLASAQDANRQKLINENAKNKAEAEKFEEETKTKKEHNQLGQDIAATMNHYSQDPVQALDALKGIGSPEASEMARKINTYYGSTLVETMRKDAETARHNKEEEDIKRAAKNNFKGNPEATTSKEFYESLTPGERSTVDLIHSGRAPLNNPGYLLAKKPEILEAVERAYPGEFDASKVGGYQKMYLDYTANGPKTSGGQLTAGSAALGHLARLKQINDENPVAVHNAATASYKQYHNLLDTVADELGTFYGEPKTNEVIQSKKATLGGLLNRDAAIVEQARAMGVKFDALENKWKEGAPGKAYEAQMPNISLEAKQTRAKLDPEYAAKNPDLLKQAQQGQQGPSHGVQVPTGKVYMQKPDGNYIFVDAAKQADAEKAGAKVVR